MGLFYALNRLFNPIQIVIKAGSLDLNYIFLRLKLYLSNYLFMFYSLYEID